MNLQSYIKRLALPALAVALIGGSVLARQGNPEAAKFVHWGATSQDIIDSGVMLQLQAALPLLREDLQLLADALAVLATDYKTTPMIGRTWMQHALPVSLGLKAAGWLDAILRHQDRLDALPQTRASIWLD